MADTYDENENEQALLEEQKVYSRGKKIYLGFFVGAIILIALSIFTMIPFGFLSAFGTSLWAINFCLTLSGIGCLLGAGITWLATRTRRLMKKASKNTKIIEQGQKNGNILSERELKNKRKISNLITKIQKRHPKVAKLFNERINEKVKEEDFTLRPKSTEDKKDVVSIDDICKKYDNDWLDSHSKNSKYEKDKQEGSINNITIKDESGKEYVMPIKDYQTDNSYEVPLILLQIKKDLNKVAGISEVTLSYCDGTKDDAGKPIITEESSKKEKGKDLFSEENLKVHEDALKGKEKAKTL